MEYSESIINGGVTYQHKCRKCGCEKHHVQGSIHYAYLFLESLPIYPVGRSVKLECVECLHTADKSELTSALYNKLNKSAFTVYHFLRKFVGLFLLIYVAITWWQSHQEQQRVTEQLITYPQINDFMLIDHRKMVTYHRPGEKYRVAKVVDITGDTVSLVLGNFFYQHESSFREAIASGQTRAYRYFSKQNYNFTLAQLAELYQRDGIKIAARPEGNMLYGNFVINDTGYRVGGAYIPGEREYASGLAFEQATYIQDHQVTAFIKFEQSAQMGFVLGQVKLAELFLAGEVVKTDLASALYWLEQASLQSNLRAIKKYGIVCQQTKDCQLEPFYQRLIDHGVNLTVNTGKGEVNISD